MAKGVRKTALPARKAPAAAAAAAGVDSAVQYVNTQAPLVKRPPPPASTRKVNLPPPPPLPPKPRSKVPLYIGGTFLYALAVYGAYVFITTSKSIPKEPVYAKPLDEQEDISHVYNNIALKYDKEIWTSEFFMGMPLLRRSMAKRATGNVLEASAGTGRNIKWYPLSGRKVTSLTMVDTSAPMLQIARKAFHKRHPTYKNVHFTIQDAAAPLASPSSDKFDTVIQSMGICSHHSPVQLLRNLGEVCKDDGNIILLEHGKSHYDWLNRILDRFAEKHADTWGCWWNRDVEAIVSESGLRVVKLRRYHFGTTYWIEAKPPLKADKSPSAK
ncbi:ubiquinone/menaquinone biosynthesis-related protein [Tricharina praecox]|uniref:ubiquinone/menaquinone biosynthesis-related protein n=1 Tax=Tricharina praecox TaxID=43433 RepID=UPI002220DD26|nr:ubiquinone/menaquinone biosynthesis-related protein [Tricharina praecox]KAI5858502.1 ubiquinone/menaquinone biosynthesis-related protein [Tricharina praecox]